MSSRKLRRLKCLSESLIGILSRHGIESCRDLLTRNVFELMAYTNLDYKSVQSLLVEVSRVIAPKASPLKEHFLRGSDGKFLPTSLASLDKCLGGGLPVGSITEITGPPGVGKTQFCMMMSVIVASPVSICGLESGVIFIDTEAAFTANRFIEILKHRSSTESLSCSDINSAAARVLMHQVSSCEQFKQRLSSLEEDIITTGAKLVIVDSIASLIRKEFSLDNDYSERNNFILELASTLKYLAERLQIAAVVTNQISTKQRDIVCGGDTVKESYITAALGNTWAHAVNTRLIFHFKATNAREVLIAKSPSTSCRRFLYEVFDGGLHMKSDETQEENKDLQEFQTIDIQTKFL